jgi:hypothetical protein
MESSADKRLQAQRLLVGGLMHNAEMSHDVLGGSLAMTRAIHFLEVSRCASEREID